MTFSIVARDPQTGAVGVATATGGPVVGSLVPHARAGVGAVATQSQTNPHFGFDGLVLLADPTLSAQDVIERLVAGDPDREARQCLALDRTGRTAAWTGSRCADLAADIARDGVAVAGNYLRGEAVLEAMVAAFERTPGRLEDRLLDALVAGQAHGGDRRGVRSAALKVYGRQLYPAVDLRADWSETPIDDLSRILAATRAAEYAGFFETLPAR
jgi:uncharacterized Ntn-hydrolase superfamily protein